MTKLSPKKVKRRIEELRQLEGDDEAAHHQENGLRAEALRAIADGRCTDPGECARLALTTDELQFKRDCA